MNITDSEFWNAPNSQGLPTFSYAELLAQLATDLPSGGAPVNGEIAISGFGGQIIPQSTLTILAFDLSVEDTGGVTNIANSELVAPVAGLYLVGANIHWTGGQTPPAQGTFRETLFYLNGFPAGTIVQRHTAQAQLLQTSVAPRKAVVIPVRFLANETIQCVIQQDGSGVVSVSSNNGLQTPLFWMTRIGA